MTLEKTGCVIIGRNEGLRFQRCLASVRSHKYDCIVYVDSGSTDGSAEFAEVAGAKVVRLDASTAFTAARARNAGFEEIMRQNIVPKLVQFLDGDCILDLHWPERAQAFLMQNPEYAAVCGRRRESHRENSVYNLLCDIEWNTPLGDALAFGGDVLIRASSLLAVGGYRNELICGEEPELCIRLREKGYRIWRLDADMTVHDANMHAFSQWWKRTMRGGYAYAKVAYLHRHSTFGIWHREVMRSLLYGAAIPLFIIIGTVVNPVALLLALIYPVSVIRTAIRSHLPSRERWIYATFMMAGKFAELQGI